VPIKAENRGRYPPNWADLRRQVLERERFEKKQASRLARGLA